MKNRIGYTPTFKKDVKRLKKAHFNLNWKGYRELHILADWLLIYKVEKDEINLVVLVRTGSHDKLF